MCTRRVFAHGTGEVAHDRCVSVEEVVVRHSGFAGYVSGDHDDLHALKGSVESICWVACYLSAC